MKPTEIIAKVLAKSANMSRPVYRGQGDGSEGPLSGAARRLEAAYGKRILQDKRKFQQLLSSYHLEKLIVPMQVLDGDQVSDIQRLSILQHYGAATGLLDFTENVLAAIWFACSTEPEKDGAVFMLDIGNHQVAKNGRTEDDPLDPSHPIVYYEPDRSLGARIIAQRSVFVICNPSMPRRRLLSVEVPQAAKEQMQQHLERLGLTEEWLFGDIPGLAAANKFNKPLQHVVAVGPEQFRDSGNRAFRATRYGEALTYYEGFANEAPDFAQPFCLKGDALAAIGQFEEAIKAYTKAIKNIDRPVYIGKGAVAVSSDTDGGMMLHAIHYNRGNAYAAIDEHRDAIADFDAALEHGDEQKRPILMNRGNSKFMLELFAEAYKDFEDARKLGERGDAALAMGNCKVMMGELEEGLDRYFHGALSEPKSSASRCGASGALLDHLIKGLAGNEYQVGNQKGFFLTIVAEGEGGTYSFLGNQGNTGNIPSGLTTAQGGEGYGGVQGFSVRVVPPPDLPPAGS